jgi:hypothetical protein
MLELKDGVVALNEDSRRPATRSASTAAKPDGTQGFAWDCCNLRKGKSERWAGALGGADGVSPAWMRR